MNEDNTTWNAVYSFEDGNWLVHIDQEPRVHTFARNIYKAQDNITDALALWLEVDPPSLAGRIVHDLTSWMGAAAADVSNASRARREAQEAQARASSLQAAAAHELVDDKGLSVRDAAYFLGISHQRVQQLVSGH